MTDSTDGADPDDEGGLIRDLADRCVEAAERVRQARAELDDVLQSASSTTGDDEHDPEGATIGFERAQAQSLLDRSLTRLQQLQDAQARARAGTYGRCVRCGAPIGAQRLAARPGTELCIACARRQERTTGRTHDGGDGRA